MQQLVAAFAGGARGDLLQHGRQAFADTGDVRNLAFGVTQNVDDALGIAFDGRSPVAVAADAERVVAGDLHQIGRLPQEARDFAIFQTPIVAGGEGAAAQVLSTCVSQVYAGDMSKMIQVRGVPDHLYATLEARAARQGMSLSDFIKKELERTAERPTMREWLEMTRRSKPIASKQSAAQIVRELRDA